MKETYHEAMTKVFEDEGGYSNDAGDSGGPTNWGITIHDARTYWKSNATASDVRKMPKSVAEDIYAKHYATPLRYNDLPAGVDYAVLDYGINSGIDRSAKVLQRIVGVPADGKIGPITVAATAKKNASQVVNAIYDERLAFLKSLKIWDIFGKGWGRRCKEGRALALSMIAKYPITKTNAPVAGPVIAATAAVGGATVVASAAPHSWAPWIIGGTAAVAFVGGVWAWLTKRSATDVTVSTNPVT